MNRNHHCIAQETLLNVLYNNSLLCACLLSCFSHVRLCDTMDCGLPGASVHGILQARILEWVVMLCPSGDLSNSGIETACLMSPALAGRFFTVSVTWEAQ